ARSAGWGALSNRFAYVTTDSGAHWYVGAPRPAGSAAGAYGLSSVALDPADTTGNTFYVTSIAMHLVDDQGNLYPMGGFGHLYKTTDQGAHWASLGTQGLASGGLPEVGFDVVKVDPGDPATLYVGTQIGLYKSL